MLKEIVKRSEVEQVIENNPDKKWYIIQTESNCEEAAKRNIWVQLEVTEVADKVAMVLLPANQVVEMKDGKKKVSNKKLFPGYIYMLADLDEHVWRATRNAGKVSRFVSERNSQLPFPVTPKEAQTMIDLLDDDGDAPTQKVTFDIDQPLRVTTGPFADFTGVVENVNYEKNKLKLKISIFGRETPIEVGFNDVTADID